MPNALNRRRGTKQLHHFGKSSIIVPRCIYIIWGIAVAYSIGGNADWKWHFLKNSYKYFDAHQTTLIWFELLTCSVNLGSHRLFVISPAHIAMQTAYLYY